MLGYLDPDLLKEPLSLLYYSRDGWDLKLAFNLPFFDPTLPPIDDLNTYREREFKDWERTIRSERTRTARKARMARQAKLAGAWGDD